MTYDVDTADCRKKSWITGLIVGVVVALLLTFFTKWLFIQAVVAGIIVGLLVGFGLIWFRCGARQETTGPSVTSDSDTHSEPVRDPGEDAIGAASAAPFVSETPVSEETAPEAASVEVDEDAERQAADTETDAALPSRKTIEIQPSTPLPGQAELAARKGDWKYESEPKSSEAAPVADPKPTPAAEVAPGAPATANKPEAMLSAPRDGQADDLKRISGVGPKLEGTLNELGVWHFDQIAVWGEKEIEWVDQRLKFKGRIVRDDWMSQAKILAAGGETEFSKGKKK